MHLLTIDLEEEDFALIGIHSAEEDYRLAYLLNKHIHTNLYKANHKLDFKNSEVIFPYFEFKNPESFINYFLINNKYKSMRQNQNQSSLFDGNYSSVSYLIPEKKNIDYFLKIEGCYGENSLKKTVEALNNIKKIITSYTVEPNSLKSKSHLIF